VIARRLRCPRKTGQRLGRASYLAIFDALNFMLVWLIARALKLKYALGLSLLIAVLPSSWVGGALWDQIDDVSQFFLLASVFCFIAVTRSNPKKLRWNSVACLSLGMFALVTFVLTKQLAIFSLPAVFPLALSCVPKFVYTKCKASGDDRRWGKPSVKRRRFLVFR
jgi:peptidoglycan/LPS O-acetylase OafA/YrhL